ncbi:hypothetical protein CB1_000591023 [Camelus ferus]|nr:hypothetical protein CB1_000591023 [Camelus ferus]
MGPRGRLPELLIGGAGRRASRGPREGAAKVQVREAGLRRALRVSSCGGGSIQRRCQQFQPVALLFSCTNIVIMPKRKCLHISTNEAIVSHLSGTEKEGAVYEPDLQAIYDTQQTLIIVELVLGANVVLAAYQGSVSSTPLLNNGTEN